MGPGHFLWVQGRLWPLCTITAPSSLLGVVFCGHVETNASQVNPYGCELLPQEDQWSSAVSTHMLLPVVTLPWDLAVIWTAGRGTMGQKQLSTPSAMPQMLGISVLLLAFAVLLTVFLLEKCIADEEGQQRAQPLGAAVCAGCHSGEQGEAL